MRKDTCFSRAFVSVSVGTAGRASLLVIQHSPFLLSFHIRVLSCLPRFNLWLIFKRFSVIVYIIIFLLFVFAFLIFSILLCAPIETNNFGSVVLLENKRLCDTSPSFTPLTYRTISSVYYARHNDGSEKKPIDRIRFLYVFSYIYYRSVEKISTLVHGLYGYTMKIYTYVRGYCG